MTRRISAAEIKRWVLAEAILRVLLGGALITTIVAMPGLATVLKPLIKEYTYRSRIDDLPILRSLYRLRERGMIRYDRSQSQWELTDKGRRRARTYELRDLLLPKPPASWDGQWRLIIFDVPERARYLRNLLRRKLTGLGFTYLQRSVWIYPYPCQKVLADLTNRLGLEGDIVFTKTPRLFPEDRLLRKYQLIRA